MTKHIDAKELVEQLRDHVQAISAAELNCGAVYQPNGNDIDRAADLIENQAAEIVGLKSNIHQLCIDQQKQLDARDRRLARLRDVLNWTNENCPLECRAKTGAALEQDNEP